MAYKTDIRRLEMDNGSDFFIGLIKLIIIYVIETIPLFVIAYRSQHPLSWLAWIPLANIWLMFDMAHLSFVWLLLIFVPFVGSVILSIMLWMRIVENTNKPSWLGFLMVIPVVNLATGYYVAFVDS